MRKGFLIYEEICEYFVTFEEAVIRYDFAPRSLHEFLYIFILFLRVWFVLWWAIYTNCLFIRLFAKLIIDLNEKRKRNKKKLPTPYNCTMYITVTVLRYKHAIKFEYFLYLLTIFPAFQISGDKNFSIFHQKMNLGVSPNSENVTLCCPIHLFRSK
jgi:hypothetical protein